MPMVSKLWNKLLYRDILRDGSERVQGQIREENRKSVIIWSSVQLLFWIFCLIMSFHDEAYTRCRAAYLAAIAVCLLTMICAAFFAKTSARLAAFAMFAVDVALLAAGVWIAVIQLAYAGRTIVLVASGLIVPVMFICSALSTLVLLLADIVAFVIAASPALERGIYEWALVNLCIFSAVGVMIGYFINRARVERYIYAESVEKLAELQTRYAYYDQMTGLLNRRAYAEKIQELSEGLPPDLCIVMADLNGLKRANDNLGHEAGDELIIGASQCLVQAFGEGAAVYRIGGDEFCVIVDGKMDEALRCLERLEKITAGWKGKYIDGISISCGVESGEGHADIDSVVQEADRKMYEQKDAYYKNSGLDRRRT